MAGGGQKSSRYRGPLTFALPTKICQDNRLDGQHCELFSKANGTGIEMLLGNTKCGSLAPVSSAHGFGHTDSTADAQPLMDIDKH